ncbi:MAG: hypothetical protein ABMA01_04720 [Chthoniobacteraceae bacterium]
MILQNCVLILGAGASIPYGIPRKGLSFRDAILEAAGRSESRYRSSVHAFCEQFGQLGYSIDRFLAECSRRESTRTVEAKKLIEIGKAAIVKALLPCESPDSVQHGWYDDLVNALTSRFPAGTKKRLPIITFNYDRSLEYHLMRSLGAIYDKADLDVQAMNELVEITHVYGQLGDLPEILGREEGAVPYGSKNPATIPHAVSAVRVVGERTEEAHINRIRERLRVPGALVFIGFGFLPENMELLNLQAVDAQTPVFASGYNLSDGMRRTLVNIHPHLRWHFGDIGDDASAFLNASNIFGLLSQPKPELLHKVLQFLKPG